MHIILFTLLGWQRGGSRGADGLILGIPDKLSVLSQVVKSAEPLFKHPRRSPLGRFQGGGEGGWCTSDHHYRETYRDRSVALFAASHTLGYTCELEIKHYHRICPHKCTLDLFINIASSSCRLPPGGQDIACFTICKCISPDLDGYRAQAPARVAIQTFLRPTNQPTNK